VQSNVVKSSAWLEIIAGAILVILPNIACRLLFRATLDSLARWVGVALLALGIACLPSKTTALRGRTVLGLFVYNAGVGVLFLWVVATAVVHGPLLWPAAILHSLVSIALLLQLLFPKGLRHGNQQSKRPT